MMNRPLGLALMLVAVCAGSGCSSPLQTYAHGTDQDALAIIAQRLESVRTISATADITLSSADRQTINLDGALVAELPERARLRAWKMGTPVFDLTVLPEGVWVFVQDERPQGNDALDMASLPAASVSPMLELLAPAFFKGASPLAGASSGGVLVVTGVALGQQRVRCEIDRPTLTPRRYTLDLASGTAELALDQYMTIDGVAWPRRLRFSGAAGDITVRLSEVELNSALADRALVPPARARKLP